MKVVRHRIAVVNREVLLAPLEILDAVPKLALVVEPFYHHFFNAVADAFQLVVEDSGFYLAALLPAVFFFHVESMANCLSFQRIPINFSRVLFTIKLERHQDLHCHLVDHALLYFDDSFVVSFELCQHLVFLEGKLEVRHHQLLCRGLQRALNQTEA